MAAQLFFNGLVTGLLLALPALALTLVFGVLKFANFAVGSMMTLGAYAGWVANVSFHLPLSVSALIAAAVVALAAVADAPGCDAKTRFTYRRWPPLSKNPFTESGNNHQRPPSVGFRAHWFTSP